MSLHPKSKATNPSLYFCLTLQLLFSSATVSNKIILWYRLTLKMTSINDPLGKLSQHERDADYDEEEGCLPCSPKIVYDNEEEESEDCKSSGDDEQSQSSGWLANFVISVALPALLFLQFGMAFSSASQVDASTTGLRWSVVNYSIVLFASTAVLYHQALNIVDQLATPVSIYIQR
jgi:hypothetical protein